MKIDGRRDLREIFGLREKKGKLLDRWEEEDEWLSRLKKKFSIKRERPKDFDRITSLS